MPPEPPAPLPAPQPAPAQPAPPTQPATDPSVVLPPPGTPRAQMTPEQELEYWKQQSRTHEQRLRDANLSQLQADSAELARLRASTQTEQERAVSAADAAGYARGRQEAALQVVEAHLSALLTGRIDESRKGALLVGIGRDQFLLADKTGADIEKIRTFVDAIAPTAPGAGQGAPAPTGTGQGTPAPGAIDTGQGGGPAGPRPSGLEAGRERARKRFGTDKTTTTT